ncbi:manganese catalase family protein, partial [Paraburkholderia sp. JPY303]|nr:manganese catalase family protein [Paraburkholderia atlantica]
MRGTADGRPTVPTPMEVTMFMHNKRLQYTVRVGTTNPGLANLM